MHLQMSSVKWTPLCLGLNVLTLYPQITRWTPAWHTDPLNTCFMLKWISPLLNKKHSHIKAIDDWCKYMQCVRVETTFMKDDKILDGFSKCSPAHSKRVMISLWFPPVHFIRRSSIIAGLSWGKSNLHRKSTFSSDVGIVWWRKISCRSK